MPSACKARAARWPRWGPRTWLQCKGDCWCGTLAVGRSWGEIGISGLTAQEDEESARLGLQAPGFSMHSHARGGRLC